MGCFIVPAVEAVITTAITRVVKKREQENDGMDKDLVLQHDTLAGQKRVPFSRKLGWLNSMLWGGSALLTFEHLWHGEITPFFPFLTAAANEEDMAALLGEMSTVGVSMAVLVTAVWGVMVVVSKRLQNCQDDSESAQKNEQGEKI